jgi:hypothetical protein
MILKELSEVTERDAGAVFGVIVSSGGVIDGPKPINGQYGPSWVATIEAIGGGRVTRYSIKNKTEAGIKGVIALCAGKRAVFTPTVSSKGDYNGVKVSSNGPYLNLIITGTAKVEEYNGPAPVHVGSPTTYTQAKPQQTLQSAPKPKENWRAFFTRKCEEFTLAAKFMEGKVPVEMYSRELVTSFLISAEREGISVAEKKAPPEVDVTTDKGVFKVTGMTDRALAGALASVLWSGDKEKAKMLLDHIEFRGTFEPATFVVYLAKRISPDGSGSSEIAAFFESNDPLEYAKSLPSSEALQAISPPKPVAVLPTVDDEDIPF